MTMRWGAKLPSLIAFGLPLLAIQATAGTVTVPDGEGTWDVTISPESGGEPGSLILLTAYQDTQQEGAVPEPFEPAEPEPAVVPEVERAEPNPEGADTYESEPEIRPAASVDPASYWAVYRTIPFIRTEYEANPSYRHEATMEFLFGQLRPTVIHKHYDVRRPVPAPRPVITPPWVYDRYLGQIPTFMLRYRPPAIPFGYPLIY